jgi:hypothetical protein
MRMRKPDFLNNLPSPISKIELTQSSEGIAAITSGFNAGHSDLVANNFDLRRYSHQLYEVTQEIEQTNDMLFRSGIDNLQNRAYGLAGQGWTLEQIVAYLTSPESS